MPVSDWTIYPSAKRFMMSGAIDLDSDAFRMSLYTSASNALTMTLSTIGSVTGEVTEADGYASKPLDTAWVTGTSAKAMRFSASPTTWLAQGDIEGVRYAVVWKSSDVAADRKLVCVAALSTTSFAIQSGRSLMVKPNASVGIFQLA